MKAEFARLDAETSKKVLQAYHSRKEFSGLEPEPPSTTPCGLKNLANASTSVRASNNPSSVGIGVNHLR